jgi:hypothetical protein
MVPEFSFVSGLRLLGCDVLGISCFNRTGDVNSEDMMKLQVLSALGRLGILLDED